MIEHEPTPPPPPARIFQACASIAGYQFALEIDPANDTVREKMIELQKQTRQQIQRWGGLEAVDAWLRENDPGHDLPSEIRDID